MGFFFCFIKNVRERKYNGFVCFGWKLHGIKYFYLEAHQNFTFFVNMENKTLKVKIKNKKNII